MTGTDARSFAFWQGFLRDAFRDLHDEIALVMDASEGNARFRESWIQGELYLRARRLFEGTLFPWPNFKLKGYPGTYPDFAFYTSDEDGAGLLAVGELKVLASTSQPKMFCGGPLEPRQCGSEAAMAYFIKPSCRPGRSQRSTTGCGISTARPPRL